MCSVELFQLIWRVSNSIELSIRVLLLQLFKKEALFIPGGWDSDDHISLLRSDKVRGGLMAKTWTQSAFVVIVHISHAII